MVNRIWQHHFGEGLFGHAELIMEKLGRRHAPGLRIPGRAVHEEWVRRSSRSIARSCCRRRNQQSSLGNPAMLKADPKSDGGADAAAEIGCGGVAGCAAGGSNGLMFRWVGRGEGLTSPKRFSIC